ncbi:MAG: serine/threonine protein kinase, partial [Deltaproteobacteria bacterium]|nr:serine/threonine protein kinase [Deltaproteobacteria bacterium]
MERSEPFGRYQLVEKLATGGMAEIFKAKLLGIEGFEKTLVIKRILPFWSERQDFVTMLVDEAKVLVHLNHPNIVQVYELGRVDNTYFIAMEYVEGVDLRQLIKKTQSLDQDLSQEVALSIMIKSLEGLQYAHERSVGETGHLGIVHRDISPQNILLSFQGDVKVTDFGIAKAVTQSHETQTGVLKGKYAYMAPEQALGLEVDRRTDLFACGIVLYEMLLGDRPFKGKSDIEILDHVRKAEVPWPEEKLKNLYPGLDEVLKQALASDPKKRYQSAEDFRDALDHCIPPGKRLSSSRLANYLKDLFKEEILQKRAKASQSQATATPSRRQTMVAPEPGDQTVSLVESKEGQALKESKGPVEQAVLEKEIQGPVKKSKLYIGIVFVFLVLLGGLSAYWLDWIPKNFIQINLDPPTPQPKVPAGPDKPNEQVLADLAKQPDLLLLTNFELRLVPKEANFVASYQKEGKEQKLEGKGVVRLEALEKGTEIKVKASLEGYIDESKTYSIKEAGGQVKEVLELKKLPDTGSISVSVYPWGNISIAGASYASTQSASREVKVGTHSVQVSHPDWGTVSASVRVRPGG